MIVIILIALFLVIILCLSYHSNKISKRAIEVPSVKTWYFAGPLFSLQQIVGNDQLVASIERQSMGKYKFSVPQKLEQKQHDNSAAIKEQDLNDVINADGILVNFNGNDLDDGTIAEFMTAKALNKPAVVLRTDFRQFTGTLTINPMLLGFPRTEYLTIDSLGLYQTIGKNSTAMVDNIAKQIITSMDKVTDNKGLVKYNEQAIGNIYVKKVLGL